MIPCRWSHTMLMQSQTSVYGGRAFFAPNNDARVHLIGQTPTYKFEFASTKRLSERERYLLACLIVWLQWTSERLFL